ncbi:MAG: nucleotide pyrophosphohydrolase [Candidatus Aenigmarchaeota archaeon]|nr:nucleotide pyrophosphohydrolase [Candidatus Aenigmarchaeota archaeon]
MSLKNIQEDVDKWISQWKVGYFEPFEALACMMEETGEVSREINHMFGPKKKKSTEEKKDLADELADTIFTICCIANPLGIDLDEAWKRMLDKFNTRDKERLERK